MASARSGETPAERFCRENGFGRRSERSQEGEEEREAREGVRAAPPRCYRRKSTAKLDGFR
jgi:hypothetical protein